MGDTFFGGNVEDAKQVGTAELMIPEQRRVLERLAGLVSGQVGEGAPAYGDEMVSGATPNQKLLFALASALGRGEGPLQRETTTTLSDILGEFDAEGVQDFFEKGIKAPALAMFEEDILPEVLEPFAGMDAMDSGAARRAAASAGRRLATDVSGQLADVLYRSREAHEGRRLWGAEEGMRYPSTLADILSGAGGTERGILNEILGAKFGEFLRTQPFNNPWLTNFLSQILGASAIQPIIQGPEYRQGILGSLVQAGGQVGAAAMMPAPAPA